ncbi:MAG TPA: biopolymer transporter ExbD [Verrucomicrobiae bacterium]|nr:biopolymer transporter ExbD [Verrucomicrobiae bacterium]
MKFRRTLSEPDESIELNLIPLIDIIMFLLIFFISTTSMMQEKALHVDKPQSQGNAAADDNKTIIISVAAGGQVLHDGKEIGLGGVRPTVKRLCAEAALPVVIQASETSRSGMMIRIIDEARMGGARDVSVASQRS